ncbi:ornithine cyclodeaminase family protein [Bacillus marinisedimentorum]|uniref:ornithine cyclodeaminase family protein n=1 Tax=Bacillus marinisedimentorum TaxID=1821260 RepID=UPI0007E04642|nr:ornithine cyclodeaminase family protein [Bacillus marinisedimentorum]
MQEFSEDEIYRRLSMDTAISSVREAFLHDGSAFHQLPERTHLHDGDNTVLIMPVFIKGYFLTKLVTVAPGNRTKGLPTLEGTVQLYDRQTLQPLARMDGKALTAIRTGALSGLSIAELTENRPITVGLIGTGTQGWTQLLAAAAVRNVTRVYAVNRSQDRLAAFKTKWQEANPEIPLETPASIEELVQKSDVILTATTSKTPVIPENAAALLSGKHVAAVGSFRPDMQELPDSVLHGNGSIFIDTPTAEKESGDIIRARELIKGEPAGQIHLFKHVLSGQAPAAGKMPFTVFKSVGSALFDAYVAKDFYEQQKG